METPPNTTQLIADAEALIDQAMQSMAGTRGFFEQHARNAGEVLPVPGDQHQETLRRIVAGHMSLAQQRPALPGTDIAIDPVTRFSRQVWRRRSTV